MAASKQSFTARTTCPATTVEGNWTLENFPALVQRARTPRNEEQVIPPEIATCYFDMNCKCVSSPVNFKVDFIRTDDNFEGLHLQLQLLDREDFQDISVWMGSFSVAVLKDESPVWESLNDMKAMFDLMTVRPLFFQFPVEFFHRNLNADQSLTIRLKVTHAPCPESGIKSSTAAATSDPEESSIAASPPGYVLDKSSQVSKDLMKGLLSDTQLTDFFFYSTTMSAYVRCHKAILAARSPVLKKKILLEKIGIALDDASKKSFDQFLCFVYTGGFIEDDNAGEQPSWIPALPEVARLAVKYEVQDLIEFCDDNFHLCVTARNALVMWKLANRLKLKNAEAKITEMRKTYAENGEDNAHDTDESSGSDDSVTGDELDGFETESDGESDAY